MGYHIGSFGSNLAVQIPTRILGKVFYFHPEFTAGIAVRRRHMKLAKYTKFREEKFGGVLFETRSEKVYSLNPTAAAVVREIAGGLDEHQIVERVKARFSDSAGAIEREVRSYLAELRQKGLLED